MARSCVCMTHIQDHAHTQDNSIFYLAVFLGTAIPYVLSTYWFTEGMDAFEDFAAVLTVSGRDWQAGTGFVFDRASNRPNTGCQLILTQSSLASIDRRSRCTQHICPGQQIRLSDAFCIRLDCHIREWLRLCDIIVLRRKQIFLPVSIYYMMIIKRQIDSLGSLTSTNAHTQHARRDRNIRQSYRLM